MVDLLVIVAKSSIDPERAIAVKVRTLDYGSADLVTKIAPAAYAGVKAPWGAVKNEEDGERLLRALEAECPEVEFTGELRRYERADRVVWNPK